MTNNKLYVYNISTSKWKIGKNMLERRAYFGYNFWKECNQIIVIGGNNIEFDLCSDIMVYDISKDYWFKSRISLCKPLSCCLTVFVKEFQQIHIFGGKGHTSFVSNQHLIMFMFPEIMFISGYSRLVLGYCILGDIAQIIIKYCF